MIASIALLLCVLVYSRSGPALSGGMGLISELKVTAEQPSTVISQDLNLTLGKIEREHKIKYEKLTLYYVNKTKKRDHL